MKIKTLYLVLVLTILFSVKNYAETITWSISAVTSVPTFTGHNAIVIHQTGETVVAVTVIIRKGQYETINSTSFALASEDPITGTFYRFDATNMAMDNGTAGPKGGNPVSTYPVPLNNADFAPGGDGTSVTISFLAHINSPTTSVVVDNRLFLIQPSGRVSGSYVTDYPINPQPFNRWYGGYPICHFYTLDKFEIYDTPNPSIWSKEACPGLVYNQQITGTVPLYRYYYVNKNDHYYTLTQGSYSGYIYEEIAAFVYNTQVAGTIPLYQYYSPTAGHFYTSNFSELGNGGSGYSYEGVACYIIQNP